MVRAVAIAAMIYLLAQTATEGEEGRAFIAIANTNFVFFFLILFGGAVQS